MTRETNTSISNVVHFPRHRARLPERPLDLPEYMERKYEMMFEEPWIALEDRVRARHPEFFAIYGSLAKTPTPRRKWWQLWKALFK